MAIGVELPALGESVVEGTVARWLVKEGERVERDQPLVEITTDKVDAEIPAPATGVLEKILVAEGQTVPVGTELARIEPGAAVSLAGVPAGGPPRLARSQSPEPERTPAPAARPQAPSTSAPRATPVAKRMAEEARVDLTGVEGTGAAGRVTKRDVQQRSASAPATKIPARPAAPAGREAASGAGRPAFLSYQLQPGDRVIPMTPLRKLVAEHMVLSKRVSPHVGTVAEIDLAGVVGVRNQHKREFLEAHGFALTFLPFVVHATVRALR